MAYTLRTRLLTRTDNHPNASFPDGKAQGWIVHMTGNASPGADAEAHANYFNTGATGQKSVQFVSDDREVWQLMRWDQQAWNAGDGAGGGDAILVALEICMHAGIDQEAAYEVAAEFIADSIISGLAGSRITQHYDWSRKNCPELLRNAGRWEWFLGRVEHYRTRWLSPSDRELFERVARVMREAGWADAKGPVDVRYRELEGDRHRLIRAAYGTPAEIERDADDLDDGD